MLFKLTECKSPLRIKPPYFKHDSKYDVPNPLPVGDQYEDLYKPKHYLVGCGKCEICDQERAERKKNKWITRLIGMIEEFRNNGLTTFHRGNVKYTAAGEVFFMTLTVSNEKYPGASWCNLSNADVKELNKNENFKRRSYRELKRTFQSCMHNIRKHRSIKYVNFVEYGDAGRYTGRIHFHCFLFCSGDVSQGAVVCRNLLERWRDLTLTSEGEYQMVSDEVTAAIYACKYAAKASYGPRVMSSQFRWCDYENLFNLQRHGFEVIIEGVLTEAGYEKQTFKGGVTTWRVVRESIPLCSIEHADDLVEGLLLYRAGLSDVGNLVCHKPTFNPYEGGFATCEVNVDYTSSERLMSPQSLRVGCCQRLIPYWQAVQLPINRYSILPKRILAVALDLFSVSVFGLDLVCKVLGAVWKWFRKKSTVYTVRNRSILAAATG